MAQGVKVLAGKNSSLSIEDLKVFDEDTYLALINTGIDNLDALNNTMVSSNVRIAKIGKARLKRLKYYLSCKLAQIDHCTTSEEVALYNILSVITMIYNSSRRNILLGRELKYSPIEHYYPATRKAILKFSKSYQELIKLRFFKNMSLTEIRSKWDINNNTFTSILNLIFLQLKGEYVAEWVGNVTKDNHIEDLPYFSAAVARELTQLGITTFEQILLLSDEQLLALPQVGPVRLAKLKQYITEKKKVLEQS